jgi:hypothetical protein
MRMRSLVRRLALWAAVVALDVVVVAIDLRVIDAAKRRGVLCDGDSLLCGGGEPTSAQYDAEMRTRMVIGYPALAVAALIVIGLLVVAWRYREAWLVVGQAGLVVYLGAVAWVWNPAWIALRWSPAWYDDHDGWFMRPMALVVGCGCLVIRDARLAAAGGCGSSVGARAHWRPYGAGSVAAVGPSGGFWAPGVLAG